MGADSFIAFYGIKFALDPDDEDEIDACDEGTDARCVTATQAGLESFTGRMTDGEDYFLYIGRQVAWLGVEHEQHVAQPSERLSSIAREVNAKLTAAGFVQVPELHFQFIGQY